MTASSALELPPPTNTLPPDEVMVELAAAMTIAASLAVTCTPASAVTTASLTLASAPPRTSLREISPPAAVSPALIEVRAWTAWIFDDVVDGRAGNANPVGVGLVVLDGAQIDGQRWRRVAVHVSRLVLVDFAFAVGVHIIVRHA